MSPLLDGPWATQLPSCRVAPGPLVNGPEMVPEGLQVPRSSSRNAVWVQSPALPLLATWL